MRLLVTGGAGFIGSNFIRYILNKYKTYKVLNLDALTYAGNLDNLRDIEKSKRYKFVKGNICDGKLVNRITKNVDVIVNFAAETHVDRSIHSAEGFIETDIKGTYTLLEAVRKNKIKRYIQVSTDEVYGSIEHGSFNEESPLKPNSPYASSKAGADLLVRSYFVTYNTPVLITRSSNNFGPYQYPEKLIPLFVTNAITDKSLPLYGDGKNVRDWIYVLDNCEGIDRVLHKGKEGEVYNIGGGNEVKNIDITKSVLEILDKPVSLINYVSDRPGHDRRYSLDCAKIKKHLGWFARNEFGEAIHKTVYWYKDNAWWWERIKSGEYQKYYKKQYGK